MLKKTNNNKTKVEGDRNKKWQKNLSCTGKTKWNQTQKITTKNKRKYSKDEWNIGKT